MIYRVRHVTRLSYAAGVTDAQFNLRLVPYPWQGQTLRAHSLRIEPLPTVREELVGPYLVNTTFVRFGDTVRQLRLQNEFTIEVVAPPPPPDGPDNAEVTAQALQVRDLSALSPAPYLFASRIASESEEIVAWAAPFLTSGGGIVRSVSSLMSAIHGEFTYKPGATDSATPPQAAFRQRKGVCQDFAHVMIIALRGHSIPAAYASGYLRTVPPPGKPRLIGADAMHAWVNVWCGNDLGWVGFDPTNNCLVRDGHVQIGMGRDYADVAPIDGRFIGIDLQNMVTSVDVQADG